MDNNKLSLSKKNSFCLVVNNSLTYFFAESTLCSKLVSRIIWKCFPRIYASCTCKCSCVCIFCSAVMLVYLTTQESILQVLYVISLQSITLYSLCIGACLLNNTAIYSGAAACKAWQRSTIAKKNWYSIKPRKIVTVGTSFFLAFSWKGGGGISVSPVIWGILN